MATKKKQTEAESAAEEGIDGEVAPSRMRRLPLKLIAIAATALLVLAGGGTAAYFILGAKQTTQAAAATQPKPPVFLDLPDTLVNLANAGGDRAQYLKIKIVLELPDQVMMQQVQPVLPRVMDAFQTYLRELRPTDLDGSAGLYRLKEELTRRVNASISPNRINAVLFKEIVVQ
ncbi:MAG: flagellar basal body-associated protein FliL [Pseudorhodoplanes sp.]|nr:hypothetical protein [Pseudorhodoplanes sp.]MCL4711393.1 flagellar basal body-associated protein FliL [Pseudorhodoplanes sp.]MCQ3942886.1 flagellar basal body-associated protein FliL [Alphaproteobacteria bacterium]GIK79203.1 MAG: flagellar basal body protein FliL [Alphaproteobacteria bacterium]